jgi:hypothetical protein
MNTKRIRQVSVGTAKKLSVGTTTHRLHSTR